MSVLTLGVHFGSHDCSAAIVADGHLLAVLEQERFNRRKHTLEFPEQAVEGCLRIAGAKLEDLDCIAYASDAELTNKYKRDFISADYSEAYKPMLGEQTAIENMIIARLGDRAKLSFIDHHLAHAASVYHTSPFDSAAIVTIDGMGNWVTTSLCHGKGKRISVIERSPHPHSLGLLYGAVTQFLGFKASSGEGKVMGLAPYGEPSYLDELRELCSLDELGLRLDLRYFSFHKMPLMNNEGEFNLWYSESFTERFGPARDAESEIEQRHADMACSIQMLLEELAFDLLEDAHRRCGEDALCLSGGVALNSTLNGKILQNTAFKYLYVLPAANDAGLAIGAALFHQLDTCPEVERYPLPGPYLGDEFSEAEIEEAFGVLPEDISINRPEDIISEVAYRLAEFKIVGWYQGRMEFGPRALGNRSILANPTKEATKDEVNARVKFRESFRPFAPVTPLEYVSEYFDTGRELPFMLEIVKVLPDKRKVIPAVTHVDRTARVQTVTEKQNPMLYKLLNEMNKQNGVPVLLNTSFNIRGEPIVRKPSEAIECFVKSGMHALAIGPFLLEKKDA